MPETARCVVCGKVELLNQDVSDALLDLGSGIQVPNPDPDPEDVDLYWPDGFLAGSCPEHTQQEAMLAFNQFPEDFWTEGKPRRDN